MDFTKPRYTPMSRRRRIYESIETLPLRGPRPPYFTSAFLTSGQRATFSAARTACMKAALARRRSTRSPSLSAIWALK